MPTKTKQATLLDPPETLPVVVEKQLPAVAEPTADMFQVIARAAADPSVDVAKLERLLALRDRELARVAEAEFHTAMRACQSEIPMIGKDRENAFTHTWYATLERVNDRVVPIYTRHGFNLSFGTTDSKIEGCVRVTCHVSHIGGHSRDYEVNLPLDGAGAKGGNNKTGVQAFGSTVSYGRRYLTLMIFNVTLCGEDTDGRLPGERPDNDPKAPKVAPRAERKEATTESDVLKTAVKAAYSMWKSERAGENISWPAFFEWASDCTGVPNLDIEANWTLELAKTCEEACR